MAGAIRMVFYLFLAMTVLGLVLGRPQDLPKKDRENEDLSQSEKGDLKTANSYGFGYGYGFGYPYGYYGLYGLGYGYGYPYYGYYGAYGYPFYG